MWPHIAIIYMNCNSQNAIYKNCKSQTACIELINCNWSIFPSCYKFLILFPAVVVPGNGCFSSFSSTPPLIAHSQSNLQFLIYLLEIFFILLQTHRTTEQSRHTYQAQTYTSNVIITVFAHDSKLQHNHTNNTIKCEYEQSTRKHHCLIWL